MFLHDLYESFDSTPQLSWRETDTGGHPTMIASFGEEGFEVIFEKAQDTWEVSFEDGDGNLGATGSIGSRSTSIFGSVISAMKEFVSSVEPYRIAFTASKSEGRDHLYRAMANRFQKWAREHGYQRAEGDISDGVTSIFSVTTFTRKV